MRDHKQSKGATFISSQEKDKADALRLRRNRKMQEQLGATWAAQERIARRNESETRNDQPDTESDSDGK